MSKIKKSMGLKGDPTLDQMNYGLNLQDRVDQGEREKQKLKQWEAEHETPAPDSKKNYVLGYGVYIRPDTVEPK